MTKFRRERVGFIFQQSNLLPTLTVLQNVLLPHRLAGRPIDIETCRRMLARVGVGERFEHRPAQLSGGQQQRVAIARALAMRPAVFLADEPTGAFDSRAAREVLMLLREAVDEFSQAVVMVTHDPVVASFADTVVFLADGRIATRLVSPSAAQLAERLATLAHEWRPTTASVRGCEPVTALRLAASSLRWRANAFIASLLAIFLGATLMMTFASLLDTRADTTDALTRTTLFNTATIAGGWVLMVVACAAAATLALSVRQRSSEMALLKSIGATPVQLRRMLVGEACLLALLAAPRRSGPLPSPGGCCSASCDITITSPTASTTGSGGSPSRSALASR